MTRILAHTHTHTLGGNFKSFCEVNQKFQLFFLLFFSIPHHTKGNQAARQNHAPIIGAYRVVQTLYCNGCIEFEASPIKFAFHFIFLCRRWLVQHESLVKASTLMNVQYLDLQNCVSILHVGNYSFNMLQQFLRRPKLLLKLLCHLKVLIYCLIRRCSDIPTHVSFLTKKSEIAFHNLWIKLFILWKFGDKMLISYELQD